MRRSTKNPTNPESEALRRLLKNGAPADMLDKAVGDRVGTVIACAATPGPSQRPEGQPRQRPQKEPEENGKR